MASRTSHWDTLGACGHKSGGATTLLDPRDLSVSVEPRRESRQGLQDRPFQRPQGGAPGETNVFHCLGQSLTSLITSKRVGNISQSVGVNALSRLKPQIPLWLKAAYTLWLLLLIPIDLDFYGPWIFLWFCHVGNLVLAIALWTESRLLFSWQTLSVLFFQVMFTLDLLGRLALGFHPIGGTEYVFDTINYPWHIRVSSMFHVFIPVLLLWGVWRLGYDRRAFGLQVVFVWCLLTICYFFSPAEMHINWVFGPYDKPQTLVSPAIYLVFLMLMLPLVPCLPIHLALSSWQRRRDSRTLPSSDLESSAARRSVD